MKFEMQYAKWRSFCFGMSVLTHKQREMHESFLSTVATDALVLKHQGVSTNIAD